MVDFNTILNTLAQSLSNGSNNNDTQPNGQNSNANSPLGNILGGILGNNKHGNLINSLIQSGSLAAVASMAFDAYKKHQAANSAPVTALAQDQTPKSGFDKTLVRAMIQAAKADGHIDDEERDLIQARLKNSDLDSSSMAFLNKELDAPVDIDSLVAEAKTEMEKIQLYLASRVALNLNKVDDQQYLSKIQTKLDLPQAVFDHVEQQLPQKMTT